MSPGWWVYLLLFFSDMALRVEHFSWAGRRGIPVEAAAAPCSLAAKLAALGLEFLSIGSVS